MRSVADDAAVVVLEQLRFLARQLRRIPQLTRLVRMAANGLIEDTVGTALTYLALVVLKPIEGEVPEDGIGERSARWRSSTDA